MRRADDRSARFADEPPAPPPRPPEEYEFDLRPVWQFFIRHSVAIVAAVVAALIASSAFTVLQPANYRAVSRVHVTRPRLQMVLEPRLLASDDFELKPLFTQARHPAVESAVQAKLGHLLNTAEVQPGNLVQRIRIQSDRDDNGLMEIVFTDQDPRRASAIANAWADAYILYAQTTLNPSAVAQKLVDGQMREAKAELERREASLRAFEAGTGLGLPIRLDDATRIELSATVGQAGSTTQMASSATIARLGTRGQDVVGRSSALTSLRTDLDRLRILKEQIRRLQEQKLPPSTIGLELERFGISANQPIAAVVAAIEARELAMIATIDGAARELRGLETGLISDMNQHSQLERDRDITRDTYVALAKKAEENKIGLASEWPVVRLFSHAPDTAPRDPPPWSIILAIAGSGGLVVGITLGLGIDVARRRVTNDSTPSRGG